MGITKCRGQRYLWVDRLCIIQDDNAAVHRSLNAIHQIFAKSALCLVALAGQDANHGLRGFRGISAPRSVDHVAFDMAGGDKLSWFNKPGPVWDRSYDGDADNVDARPKRDVGSIWNERGWTYQEFIFAKRRLVFTDGPLRWVCLGGSLREEALVAVGPDSLVQMPSVYRMEQPYPGLDGWASLIASAFNERHLRYQEDALRAFLGVQNFMSGYFLGGLNYGHPDIFFDYSLVWEPLNDVERRVASVVLPPEEDNLPSWSWLGWQGAFYFVCDSEYECIGTCDGIVEPVTQWFAMQSPSTPPAERRAINCRWHQYKTLAQNDPGHVPKGWNRVDSGSGPPVYEFGDQRFRYPIPPPPSTEASEPAVQLQFLFAKTYRAFFVPRRIRPEFNNSPQFERLMELYSNTEELAGVLRVHKKLDIDRFLAHGTAEFVAVAKGWTTEFSDYLMAPDEIEELRRRPGDRPRSACYFGLCIRWENGVARRQGTGKILTDLLERDQEHVDLVLG
ncbi:hypothetical protein QQZ08_006142 [Neonectria magnoliae]|uniref:Heterokaryon incompatibility domain-containing protein n=1 Tax=Neonectria magnoliae TaxID=2732573 RepID=A0ABR1I1H7_9HYPO